MVVAGSGKGADEAQARQAHSALFSWWSPTIFAARPPFDDFF